MAAKETGLVFVQRPHDYTWFQSKSPSTYYENIRAPQSGSITNLTGQASTSTFSFIINKAVQNLNRSVLTGTYTLSAPNAGLCGFIANRPWIDAIRLINTSSMQIVNLTFAQEYMTICRLRQMTWDKWLSKQLSDHACPSRVPTTDPQALIAIPTAIGTTKSSASPAMIPVPACQLDADLTGPLMIRSVPAAAIISTSFSWMLGDLFPDTFFGCDMDLIFPEDLTLSVDIAAETTFFWSANSQDDATLGAVLPTVGQGSLTNFRLRVMTQRNPTRISETIRLCSSGFYLPIPFTTPLKYGIPPNAGNISQDQLFGSGHGTELRYIVVAMFDQDRTTWHSMNCSNIDGQSTYGKVVSYQTKIGSDLQQVAPLNCTPIVGGFTGVYQDYEWNRKLGGDSPIYQTRLTYQQLWHHIDDFKASKPTGEEAAIQKSMILGGIPLSGVAGAEMVMYNFTATLPAITPALNLMFFPTFTKTLRWGASSVAVL